MNRTVSLPAGSESFNGLRLVAKVVASAPFDLPDGFRPDPYPRPLPQHRTFPYRAAARPAPRPTARVSLHATLLWTAVIAVTVLGALWQFVALPDAHERLDAFPVSGYGFASQEAAVDDAERAVFEGASVLKRIYQVADSEVLVRVVDASGARRSAADPAFLFESTGWVITGDQDVPLPGGNARHLALRRNGQTSEALLWYSDLRTRHASGPKEWWRSALRRLTFGTTGPASVLVILQAPPSPHPVAWDNFFDRLPALFDL